MLKAVVTKIDDVEEKFRDLYVQRDDKWQLQVEGIKTEIDIKKLQDAAILERKEHGETKAKLKSANDTLAGFGEVTPDQITSMTEKLANFEAANTPELTKNFEKIVSDRVAAALEAKVKAETAKLSKQFGDLDTQFKATSEENKLLKLADQHRTIDDAVRAAASKAKVLDIAVPDALMRARGAFSLTDGKVVTQDGLTPSDWIEARKNDAGHWWPAARGAGAMGSDGQGNFIAGDNPWSKNSWNVTKQGQLIREDAAKADRLAKAAHSFIGATAPAKE